MSRDYKTKSPPQQKSAAGRGGGFLLGLVVGLLLGLAIALGVAWYVNKMPSPFVMRAPLPSKAEPAKGTEAPRAEDKAAVVEAKPRFDFYTILPGKEEPATEQQLKDAAQKGSTAQAKEAFFLQAGAFQNAPDADNLKARLALIGIEASIQTTTLPEKGVWHRVRLGPYTSVEELNKVRETLRANGIEAALVRVRDAQAAK